MIIKKEFDKINIIDENDNFIGFENTYLLDIDVTQYTTQVLFSHRSMKHLNHYIVDLPHIMINTDTIQCESVIMN